MTRSDFYKILSQKYVDVFFRLKDLEDNEFVTAISSRNPMVTTYLSVLTKCVGRSKLFESYKIKSNWYIKADFISPEALEVINSGKPLTLLTYEHIVCCKNINNEVVRICKESENIEEAVDRVYNILVNNYYTATITREENKTLKRDMPKDWKFGDDPFIRYRKTSLLDKLIDTKLFD